MFAFTQEVYSEPPSEIIIPTNLIESIFPAKTKGTATEPTGGVHHKPDLAESYGFCDDWLAEEPVWTELLGYQPWDLQASWHRVE